MTILTDKPISRSPYAMALLASLVANLFLVGFILSACIGKHHQFDLKSLAYMRGSAFSDRVEHLLDAQDAAVFHEIYQSHVTDLTNAQAHVDQARKNLSDAFKKEPLDEAGLKSVLENYNQSRAEASKVADDVIETIYTKISPAGRERMAGLNH